MLREIDQLAEDLPALVEGATAELFSGEWDDLSRPFDCVRLIGCGDSLQAATAAVMFLAELAGLEAQAVGPHRVATALANEREKSLQLPKRQLFIGISASGGTPATCEALRAAKAAGAVTLALTGQPGSPIEAIVDHTLVVSLADKESSPGIRSYQASLAGLFVLAVRLGVVRGGLSTQKAQHLLQLLKNLAEPLRITTEALEPLVRTVAEETARFPMMLFLAAGPHLATARYAAAKRIEASGLCAWGQDFEEAWHVERFALPRDLPVAIIGPPGLTAKEAELAALNARGLGRRVFTLSAFNETNIRRHAHVAFDLAAPAQEIFAPFVCHPVFSAVAAHEALVLDRTPFRIDMPEMKTSLEAYKKSIEP